MHYRHLRQDDREVIQKMKDQGYTQTQIAKELGVSKSTISRELHRLSPETYYAKTAQKIADAHRKSANSQRAKRYDRLVKRCVLFYIRKKCSPEQIAGRIKVLRPKDKHFWISHECIYQMIYFLAQEEGYDFRSFLRHKKRNCRRKRVYRAKSHFNEKKKSIHSRPEEIESRESFGHWEGDLIEGKKASGVIMTFVDRKSRYTLAGKLPNKRAENFNRTARDTFAELDEIKSITYDNGTEMSGFDDLEQILDCPIFFADPGKPGQRGLNENTNGLLRQYFRKYSDFSKITQKDVDKALFELNNRPRKCLDFLTPAEVFSESKMMHT